MGLGSVVQARNAQRDVEQRCRFNIQRHAKKNGGADASRHRHHQIQTANTPKPPHGAAEGDAARNYFFFLWWVVAAAGWAPGE